MINIFLKPFILPDDDDELADRMRVCPQAIPRLSSYDVGEGGRIVEMALKRIFTPTAQNIKLTRTICGIGRAYLTSTYSDESSYKAKCNTEDVRPKDPGFVTALVGLGGTGKSQIIWTIERLLNSNNSTISVAGLPQYPIDSIWVLTMTTRSTLPSLLEPYVTARAKGNEILKQAAKRAFTNGVGIIPLNESQFVTATQAAHANAAKLVMSTTYIGPPPLIVANYSMINKLEKRPQQERDRLLSNVLALHPERHGSMAFRNILDDQLVVFGEAVAGDDAVKANDHACDIHNYTYGINRKSAILLNFAWRRSRERGSSTLTMDDVKYAYTSSEFSSHREEVELLRKQSLENHEARDDLWCKFAPPQASNVIDAEVLKAEKKKRVEEGLTRSTMTKAEREAYDTVTGRGATKAKPKAKVVQFKGEKTLSALQNAGAELLDQYR